MTKNNEQYYNTIKTQYKSIGPDFRNVNAHRYSRNISGGNQEYIEAACFEHYLIDGTLLTYDDARQQLRDFSKAEVEADGVNEEGEAGNVDLSMEDYLLGVFDMTGELMRFAITAMATSGSLPSIASSSEHPQNESDDAHEVDEVKMDVDDQVTENEGKRDVLTDLRALRAQLERFDAGSGPFARDVDKKMDVMKSSVEKVEKALYGLVIRGRERPKGWMPDLDSGPRAPQGGKEVDVEA